MSKPAGQRPGALVAALVRPGSSRSTASGDGDRQMSARSIGSASSGGGKAVVVPAKLVAAGLQHNEAPVELVLQAVPTRVILLLQAMAPHVPRPPKGLLHGATRVMDDRTLSKIVAHHAADATRAMDILVHDTVAGLGAALLAGNTTPQPPQQTLSQPPSHEPAAAGSHAPLSPMALVTHQLWEFVCRDDLTDFIMETSLKGLCTVLRTPALRDAHQSAIAVLGRLAAVPHFATAIHASGAVGAVLAAAQVHVESHESQPRNFCDFCRIFVSALMSHQTGFAVLGRGGGMPLLSHLMNRCIQHNNSEHIRRNLQLMCHWVGAQPTSGIPCLVQAQISRDAVTWVSSFCHGFREIELLCLASIFSRFAASADTRSLLAFQRVLQALHAMWGRIPAVQTAILDLPISQQVQAQSHLAAAKQHIAACIWAGMAELSGAAGRSASHRGLEPAACVGMALDLLKQDDPFCVTCGLALLASVPTHAEMGAEFLSRGVLKAIHAIMLKFESMHSIMDVGMCALAVAVSMDAPELRAEAWRLHIHTLAGRLIVRDRDSVALFLRDNKYDEMCTLMTDHARMLHAAASVMLWMHSHCLRPEISPTTTLLTALQLPDINVIQCAALGLWSAARTDECKERLIGDGLVQLLCRWIFAVLSSTDQTLRYRLPVVKPAHQPTQPVHPVHGPPPPPPPPPDGITRVRQQLLDAPHYRHRLLEAALSCMWLIVYHERCRRVLVDEGLLLLIVDIVRSKVPEFATSQHMAVSILWITGLDMMCKMAMGKVHAMEACFDLARRSDIPAATRTLTAGLLLDLLRDDMLKTRLTNSRGNDYQERLLVDMLSSLHAEHRKWAAVSISRQVTAVTGKHAVAELGGALLLVGLLRRAYEEHDHEMAVACSHALLNITTEPACQVAVGKAGIDFLADLGDHCPQPELQQFAKRILRNLAKNTANRTGLYKAELRLKGEQWRQAAVDPAAIERELDEYDAESGDYLSRRGSLANTIRAGRDSPLVFQDGDSPPPEADATGNAVAGRFLQWFDEMVETTTPPTPAATVPSMLTRRPSSPTREVGKYGGVVAVSPVLHSSNRPGTAGSRPSTAVSRRKSTATTAVSTVSGAPTRRTGADVPALVLNASFHKAADANGLQKVMCAKFEAVALPPEEGPSDELVQQVTQGGPAPPSLAHVAAAKELHRSMSAATTRVPSKAKAVTPSMSRVLDLTASDGTRIEGPQLEVRLTESRPYRWDPKIVACFQEPSKTPTPSDKTPPTTLVLAARTARHRVQFRKPGTRRPHADKPKRHPEGPRIVIADPMPDIPPPSPRSSVRMATFKHVDGCQVCLGLYKHYQLPDGSYAHYYHEDDFHELLADAAVPPPAQPLQLHDIFLSRFPVCQRYGPPRTGDVPAAPSMEVLDPWVKPRKHQLAVDTHQHPDDGEMCTMYGYLPDKNWLCFTVEVTPPPKVEVKQVEVDTGPKEEVFDLRNSVFKPRLTESAARDFYDTEKVQLRAFAIDWQRVVSKQRVMKALTRCGVDESELASIEEVMRDEYSLLSDSFDYYAAKGGASGDAFSIVANSYFELLEDCKILGQNCKRPDAELIFKVVNLEEDGKSEENEANADRALCRYELLEALLRLAIARFVPHITKSVSQAVRLLFDNHIRPKLASMSFALDSNEFRRNHLYTKEVNAVFAKHLTLLHALHAKYCHYKVGIKQTRMDLNEWLKLIKDCDLIDDDFTRQEAVFAFTFSKMQVVDELKQNVLWKSLTATDFLEALARVAAMSSLPTREEMAAMQTDNAAAYLKALLRAGLPRPRRASSEWNVLPTRPLAEKIERLLEIMFVRLDRSGDGQLTLVDLRSWV